MRVREERSDELKGRINRWADLVKPCSTLLLPSHAPRVANKVFEARLASLAIARRIDGVSSLRGDTFVRDVAAAGFDTNSNVINTTSLATRFARRSITRFPPNAAVVNTVDYFRTFHNDPFTFGKLAAVHALSDVHAMGATATGALALATVELAEERVTEEVSSRKERSDELKGRVYNRLAASCRSFVCNVAAFQLMNLF